MGAKDRSTPPSQWCDWWETPVTMLTDTIGYGWPGEPYTDPSEPQPWFWHWCRAAANGDGRWMAQATSAHTFVSREPLHLEPSLLWPCCGTHGWVHDGAWVPA